MLINFEKYVDYLVRKKLTPNQFAFLWMVFHKDWKNIRRYNKEVGKFSKTDINDLIDKQFILYTKREDDRDKLSIDEMVVTHLFSDEILITDPFEALSEVLDVYPQYFMIDRKKQSTTSCDLDQLADKYFRTIKGDKIEHKVIVRKTKIVGEMMENKELNYMGFKKYIEGRNWKLAEEEGKNKDLRRDL